VGLCATYPLIHPLKLICIPPIRVTYSSDISLVCVSYTNDILLNTSHDEVRVYAGDVRSRRLLYWSGHSLYEQHPFTRVTTMRASILVMPLPLMYYVFSTIPGPIPPPLTWQPLRHRTQLCPLSMHYVLPIHPPLGYRIYQPPVVTSQCTILLRPRAC
jgi:hypothetical protein